jgi:hypothetical protein
MPFVNGYLFVTGPEHILCVDGSTLLKGVLNLIQNTSKQQNAHSLTTPALRKLLKKRVEFWIASAAD